MQVAKRRIDRILQSFNLFRLCMSPTFDVWKGTNVFRHSRIIFKHPDKNRKHYYLALLT